MTSFKEDMISSALSPATNYHIEIRPYGGLDTADIVGECESVLLELEIIPTSF